MNELFWMVLILILFFPALQKRLLHWKRQWAIRKLEKDRDSRVILLVHRQESMGLLGIPFMRYIDVNDSEEVLRAIKMTDDDVPIDLVIQTPGGLVLASLQIARALKNHPARVTVFVPHLAMSGGTLIALAADEIVMSDHAVLGPVDPQIGPYPAASISSVVESKPIGEIDDQTLVMADVGKKAMRQLKGSVAELLPDEMSVEDRDHLGRLLSKGAWTHDYPLNVEALRRFELNVTTDMPDSIYDLMQLYRQPLQQVPSVEYTPEPRHSKGQIKGSPWTRNRPF